MTQYIQDGDGDRVSITGERDGITIGAIQIGSNGIPGQKAYVGPVDPHVLINSIREEAGLDGPELPDDPIHSPVVESVAEQINSGETTLTFEEAIGRRSSGEHVHTRPATAEEPRLWAGADEPVIDGLIGRVADLEDEKERTEAHQHLAEHWERRLAVVQQALTMVPAPAKRGGMLAAFAGEEAEQADRIEKALKIARFAADEDRDLPGVDR